MLSKSSIVFAYLVAALKCPLYLLSSFGCFLATNKKIKEKGG